MSLRRSSDRGFTLIELLTVIAIIGILASFTAAVLPRALERAKVARLVSTMKQIQTSLVSYYADHATYPARYGYWSDAARTADVKDPNNKNLVIFRPYMAALRDFRNTDLYDNFATSGDMNNNDRIDLLEYSPQGRKTGPDSWSFEEPDGSVVIYDGNEFLTPTVQQEVLRQLRDQPPFLYFPVNKRQVRLWANFWFGIDPDNPRPRSSDSVPTSLANMTFPPPTYDAAVLISVGPENTVRGVVPTNVALSFSTLPDLYHVLGIMAYYLASRDANDNGKLDFDFLARSRDAEGLALDDSLSYLINELPDILQGNGIDAVAQNAGGPIILVIN